jgi:hypothetical protein
LLEPRRRAVADAGSLLGAFELALDLGEARRDLAQVSEHLFVAGFDGAGRICDEARRFCARSEMNAALPHVRVPAPAQDEVRLDQPPVFT